MVLRKKLKMEGVDLLGEMEYKTRQLELLFEPVKFSVPSAHNPDNRFHPEFNGANWTCDCEHFKKLGTECRHILEKKLELERTHYRLFNGPAYEPILDEKRLKGQMMRVFMLMMDGEWRTLEEIEKELNETYDGHQHPQASISAQLRHLRKIRFGKHTVDRRRAGDDVNGLWEYRLIVNIHTPEEGIDE